MKEPEGQLWPREREFLFNAVRMTKPLIVLEIGCWKGGGSTMQIAMALRDTPGKLYTCDPDQQMFQTAKDVHYGNNQVWVFHLASIAMIRMMMFSRMTPDFLFFDGPEDAHTALDDLMAIEGRLQPGATFCMHDWDAPSIKAEKIRPYMEGSKKWQLVSKLTKPESVGICRYQKL
jgi:predicted O-methyltransferase YrrM